MKMDKELDDSLINFCSRKNELLSHVKNLVENGANVNATYLNEKNAPILYACENGHINMVKDGLKA